MNNKEICYKIQNDLEAFYDVYKKLLGEEGSFLNKITKYDNYYQLEYNYIVAKFYDYTIDVNMYSITGENYIKLEKQLNIVKKIPSNELEKNYYNNIYSLKIKDISNKLYEDILKILMIYLKTVYC